MQDLGTLGGRQSRAIGVSSSGAVVGWAAKSTNLHAAFVWTPSSGMQALPALARGKACQANHASGSGLVAGFCLDATKTKRAVLWTPNGGSTGSSYTVAALPLPAGWSSSEAVDVNDAGVVAGVVRNTTGSQPSQAFRWTPAGGTHLLWSLPTDAEPPESAIVQPSISAARVSSSGVVAGTTWGTSTALVARWDSSTDTVAVHGEGASSIAVYGANDAGEITETAECLSFLAVGGGSLQLPVADCGAPQQANSLHDVAGWDTPDGTHSRAYVWRFGDPAVQYLPFLAGGTSAKAMDINDARQVAGWSTLPGGTHAVLWTLQ